MTKLLSSLLLALFYLVPPYARADKPIYWHPYAGSVFAAQWGPPIQLFNDPYFNNGFRAAWSCSQFDGDDSLGLGVCRDYYSPYVNYLYGTSFAAHTWPDPNPASYYSDENKYWDFNEGIHEGFSDSNGRLYPAGANGSYSPGTQLGINRLETNAMLISAPTDPNQIFLESFNTDPAPNPHAGGLVRTVVSDRHGYLIMYMDTSNEIRNVATDNGPTFAVDTWPHFFVGQNFKQLIDLATFTQVLLSFNVDIPFVTILNNPIPNATFSDATYNVGFTLRRKDQPAIVLFLGYTLYSQHTDYVTPPEYSESFGGDQWGQAFYRGDVWGDLGGPLVPGTGARNVMVDLRSLMNKAIAKAQANGVPLQQLEDYYLAAVGFGWETMGHEQVRSDISGVSLTGNPDIIFDSEVYQDSIYDAYNGDLPWAGDGAPGLRRAHWKEWGVHEGRVASPTFDVKIYVERWGGTMPQCYDGATPDYECAVAHYVTYGRNAGHPGHW
jgi:hypothetical protein